MQLVEDWKVISTRAWSMRFTLVGCVFSSAEAAMALINNDHKGVQFAVVSFLISLGAAVSRVVLQPTLRADGAAGTTAASVGDQSPNH